MRIAIEAQRIFRRKKHGMDFVALEMIRHLQKIDKENEYFIFVAPGEDHCLKASDNFRIVELRCPSYPLWEQIALPLAVKKVKADILHCTSNTAPIFAPCDVVLTLHDIIFLEKRRGKTLSVYQSLGWHYRRFVVPKILDKCRKIITVSEFERGHISRELGLSSEVLKTVYNGFSEHFKPVTDPYPTTQKYLPEKDFLFFLGNTDPKKNTARTLLAYCEYLSISEKKLPLLIADISKENILTILREQNITHIEPHLRYSGYIANTDLPAIYSATSAFLYTSLRESFGIPILEAMACGAPVITSNTSSMPEIAADGALFADPLNHTQIAGLLIRLEREPDLAMLQRDYGFERVKMFSWEKTAENTLKIYSEV